MIFFCLVSNCCTSLQTLPVDPCQGCSLLLLVHRIALDHRIIIPALAAGEADGIRCSLSPLSLFLVQAGHQCGKVVGRVCSLSGQSTLSSPSSLRHHKIWPVCSEDY